MRPAVPAILLSCLLLLSTGAAAHSQSANPPSISTQTPSPFTEQPRDFSKLPPGWRMSADLPRTFTVFEPGPKSLRPWDDARIDPGLIVHPPQSSLGDRAPGTLVAQNVFPGLRIMPIERPNLRAQIPTTWPLFELHPIPTDWPKYKLLQVESGTLTGRPEKTERPER